MCSVKKFRFSDSVTRYPYIRDDDEGSNNIELDSLEDYNIENRMTKNEPLQRLNLNGLCNIKNELDQCLFVNEIVLSGESLQSLSDLKVLSLRSNSIQTFPNSILKLTTLTSLDLADNKLLTLPTEICFLKNLIELILDQNLLSVLPLSIWNLEFLKVLKVANNRLTIPIGKPTDMRALIFSEPDSEAFQDLATNHGLTTLNLRANRLKGNIILGNYGNLTELDVSENSIENLDLSALEQLQTLQCSRNCLIQLKLHGKNLISIIAGNNRLKNLDVRHPPLSLKHFDISYNEMESLPNWLSGCNELRSLFAINNRLTSLPEHLFCNEMPFFQTLQIAYNQLQQLPIIQRRLPIQELFLQNNSLASLPENLFKYVRNLRVLNLSNNRLCDLPQPEENLHLEKLFLTANCLIDRSLEKIAPYLKNIKIFHAAYNCFTYLPKDCAYYWPEIEEIVFSGNKLERLPEQIAHLKHLNVLRIHSNLLKNIPKLSNLTALRVLDLAHNQLDRIDLITLIPPNLKFLDLSCNDKLFVDSQQFNTYRTQRPMSLVDVSGKNRTSLPLNPAPFCESDPIETNWMVGFSETSGCKQKLYISQIRLPAFCNIEGLFGMFDGENNNTVPIGVDKVVPRILLEERTVKETASEYMKYTLLAAQRELKDKSQKQGLNAIICHIVKIKQQDYSFCSASKKFLMKIASIGDIKIVLGRAVGPVRLLPQRQRTKQIRTNPQLQLMIPDPECTDIYLDEQDEFMIIANKNLWDVISPENAIKEVSLIRNVILAAKRLQDLAQSYGAEENLSIIVVKFNLIRTSDVDLLMRELRHTIRKNKYPQDCQRIINNDGCGCCCCAALDHSEKLPPPPPPPPPPPLLMNDDRSSPSGQSEHACSDCNSSAKQFISQLNKHCNDVRSIRSITPSIFEKSGGPERRSYRGVAKALRAKRDEDRNNNNTNQNDSDSGLSEEQFKCWEYMLEQNTQLLFDKELNTLTKNIKKPSLQLNKSQISRSNPHLSEINNNNNNGTFLSRQFGSTRSFNPLLTRVCSKFSNDTKKHILGGPNAAYFGSLQRLMPYNLEYDFAVMHERGLADSLELDRMQQYWGVTTTEL